MSTRRALLFSFLDRYAALVVSIVSSMFIARLLTPAEIGVFSVTMVLLTVVTSLRDLGAGQYLVQEKELTQDRIRAAWTVSLCTGLSMALVVLLAAKPIAIFYGEPRMVHIVIVIALNFALNPFGSLTYAWLMREMRFDALAVMRFCSGLAGAVLSVSLAWADFGALSLALGSLATTAVNGLVAAAYRPRGFPLRPGFQGLRRVLSAGSKYSANGLLSVVGGASAEVLIGKLQSLASAAMYSRANGLAMMFNRLVMDATNVVAIPMFARESRELGSINKSFIRAAAYVTALGWSFFLGMAIMAYPAIRLLYGDQWDDAVDPARIMALAYAVGLPGLLCPSALMACSAPGVMVRTSASTTVLLIAALAAGSAINLISVALGLLVAAAFGTLLWLRAAHGVLKFNWSNLFQAFAKSAGVSLCCAAGPAAAVAMFGLRRPEIALPLIVAIVGGMVCFIAAVYVLDHPIKDELARIGSRFSRAKPDHA